MRPDWQVVEVWANVQRQGGSNAAHSHPGSFWAGVYYVDVGEVSSTNDRGGSLQLYDPRGCLPRMLAPYLTYSLPELHDAGTSIAFTPSTGQCVLFPGWLFHAVTTYRGLQPRISVAFNLDPMIHHGAAKGDRNASVQRKLAEDGAGSAGFNATSHQSMNSSQERVAELPSFADHHS